MPAVAEPEQATEILAAHTDYQEPAGSRPTTLPDGLAEPSPSADGNFQKGIAISVWQNSGGENSNWGRFTERSGACCAFPLHPCQRAGHTSEQFCKIVT